MAGQQLVGIDADRVRRWLDENVEGLQGPVEFRLLAGGRSNLTYQVTDAAGQRFALRRPPTGGVLSTAHDVHREWRFISALSSTGLPVPPPAAFCGDHEVTGSDFYVMRFVDGEVLADAEAGGKFPEQSRQRAAEQTIDVLVALHQVDPHAVGLGDMVRRTSFIERQLRRWKAQLDATGVGENPLLDEVHDLLLANVPAQGNGIVHGDYRPGNLAYASDGTIVGIFDWELATSGDAMADLGWLMSSWQEPGEATPATTPGPSTVSGYGTRDELVSRYAAASGQDVSNLPYWIAFSRWRSACIGAGVRARYAAGHMADDGYDAQSERSDESIHRMAEAARAALKEVGI